MNREHRYAAYIGFLLGLLIALILSAPGCGMTSFSRSPDGTIAWESRTLFKDVEGVEAKVDDIEISLGKSAGNGNEVLLACLIAPQLGGCPQ